MLVCLNTSCVVSKNLFSFFQELARWVLAQPNPCPRSVLSWKKVCPAQHPSQTRLPRLPSCPRADLRSASTELPCSGNGSATSTDKICFHFRLRRQAHTTSDRGLTKPSGLQWEQFRYWKKRRVFAFWLGYLLPIYDIP